ncbi:MAG TPA: DUF3164 family protein [Bacteroidales bacterium]|nr:DUF3164 family protein [Bacteroidales bacterium]
MIQKVKEKQWKDETGRNIPIEYISAGNRLKERHAGALVKQAKQINKQLAEFKKSTAKLCTEVYQKMMEEFKTKAESKGNFTWFSFDRSIKIEVSISDRIDFDDLTITACKSKLDEFLTETLDSKQEFVKDLVADAFSTSRGKLDAKKVMGLLKYRTKIKAELFQEALNLLESSIRKPESKTYFRIWERAADGSYELIDLNFSSI